MDKASRRKTLKALAMGAPAVWAKPVVDAAILPAHAATTNCDCALFNGNRVSAMVAAIDSPCDLWELQTWFGSDNDCTADPDVTDLMVPGTHVGSFPAPCPCDPGEQLSLPCGEFTIVDAC